MFRLSRNLEKYSPTPQMVLLYSVAFHWPIYESLCCLTCNLQQMSSSCRAVARRAVDCLCMLSLVDFILPAHLYVCALSVHVTLF